MYVCHQFDWARRNPFLLFYNPSFYLFDKFDVYIVRCREKQRKEASRLQTVNRKLTAMNKLLMEENDRLQKQVSRLVYKNGYMRQQLRTVSSYKLFHVCLVPFMSSGPKLENTEFS